MGILKAVGECRVYNAHIATIPLIIRGYCCYQRAKSKKVALATCSPYLTYVFNGFYESSMLNVPKLSEKHMLIVENMI